MMDRVMDGNLVVAKSEIGDFRSNGDDQHRQRQSTKDSQSRDSILYRWLHGQSQQEDGHD